MRTAFIIDAVRTPFGRYGGALAGIRTDDLAALPLAELVRRVPGLDPGSVEDVIYGDANQAGEDNRNVARMAALLAGLPAHVPGSTVNRLCGSGAEALVQAGRAVAVGDADLVVAGGVEGMSRAPFVLPRPTKGFPQSLEVYPTTVGWRMVNPRFPEQWTQSLGACTDQLAAEYGIGREAQDAWALRSHQRALAAWEEGRFDAGVVPAGELKRDESIRPDTSMEALAKLKPAFVPGGTITAGNASPINDGAIAMLVGSERAVERLGARPLGRIVASAVSAVEPHRFAIAPVAAIRKAVARAGVRLEDLDVVELNEAFAAMVLCCLADLPEIDPERVNPNGGAIAIGHPLGASAARVVADLCRELGRRGGGIGVAAACIGVGQGIAVVCEAA